jgi:hypothetical protein
MHTLICSLLLLSLLCFSFSKGVIEAGGVDSVVDVCQASGRIVLDE